MNFGAIFYEADIQVDAILSFPWMAEHKIAVFPHKRALAIDHPVLTLLFGLSEGTRGKKKVSVVRNLENASMCTESSILGSPRGGPQVVNIIKLAPEGDRPIVPGTLHAKKSQKKVEKKAPHNSGLGT